MIWSILEDLRVTIKILILFARWGSEVNGERNASQSARRCMSSDSMIEVDDSSMRLNRDRVYYLRVDEQQKASSNLISIFISKKDIC